MGDDFKLIVNADNKLVSFALGASYLVLTTPKGEQITELNQRTYKVKYFDENDKLLHTIVKTASHINFLVTNRIVELPKDCSKMERVQENDTFLTDEQGTPEVELYVEHGDKDTYYTKYTSNDNTCYLVTDTTTDLNGIKTFTFDKNETEITATRQ